MSWISRVVNVFRSSDVDRALNDEIRFHIESRIEELVAGGMSPEIAETIARRQFGSPMRVREVSRDVKLMPWVEELVRDVRHGVRALRRSPVFTCVAILTFALGIGVNAAIFSIVNGVVLRPLAYPRPAQLMFLSTPFPALGFPQFWASVPEYLEFQQFNRSFAQVGAFRTGESNLLAGERALLGIRLALGAKRGRVLRQVMMQGLTTAGLGVAIGLAAALGLSRFLTSLLFGVEPADAMTLLIAILTVVGIAALACWLPAWRASRLDPNLVLRAE